MGYIFFFLNVNALKLASRNVTSSGALICGVKKNKQRPQLQSRLVLAACEHADANQTRAKEKAILEVALDRPRLELRKRI